MTVHTDQSSVRSFPFKRRGVQLTLRVATTLLASGAFTSYVWRPDLLTAMTLIPGWLWLLPGIASTVCAWRLNERFLAIVLSILWMIFCVGWVEESRSLTRSAWTLYSPITRSNDTVRIVTLNCDSNRKCVEEISHAAPDIVLLQESPGLDQLKSMSEQLFAGDGQFITAGDVSILARGRVEATHIVVGSHYVVATVTLIGQRPIECVCVRLAPPVSRLDFWSSGFWADHEKMRERHHQQLREILQAVAQSPHRSARIVGGDFNMPPLDRAFSEISDELSDTFTECGVGWGATGTNDLPLFRVDQIWCSHRFQPVTARVEKSKHSDHRLVVCELRLGE